MSYLNKFADQYSNTSAYSTLAVKIETNCKAPKLKFNNRVRITNCKIIFRLLHWNLVKRIIIDYDLKNKSKDWLTRLKIQMEKK